MYIYYLKIKCKEIKIEKKFFCNGFVKIWINRKGKLSVGKNVIINSRTNSNLAGIYKKTTIAVTKDASLFIGNNCGFSGISIYVTKSIKIGNNVGFGVNCMLWDTDFHRIIALDRIFGVQREISREIIIEDNVWIGGNVIILKGTKIGRNSVIAAGSVVAGRIPQNQVWGGNPARFLYSIETDNNL